MTSLSMPVSMAGEPKDRGWLVIGLCWLALAFAWSVPNLAEISTYTGATDDTMRLVQVRSFMDGAGWFGLHEARLNPPYGLDSHWSRFVDLPIAALILLGRPIFGPTGAEVFALCAWPALTYLAMMIGFVLIGRKLAPAAGPLPMIAAFIACLPVMGYFRPLAIDHHNVQMTLAMLLIACAVWAADRPAAALLGGICAVFVTAIGFESLHLLAGVELLVLGLAVFGGPRERRAAVIWFTAQGLAIVPVYLLNTPPQFWLRAGCDALQVNMAVMLLLGSLGVAGALRLGAAWRSLPLAAFVALPGLAAVALGYALDPSCLAGPNAAVSPEAISLWMNNVEEAQSWMTLLGDNPPRALIFMTYPILAFVFALALAIRRQLDAPLLVLLVSMLIATLVMFTQVRGFTYAAITGAIVIAVAGCRLLPSGRLAPILRICAGALLPVVALASIVLLTPKGPAGAAPVKHDANGEEIVERPVEEACIGRGAFDPLKPIPAAYVLNHIDLGPGILLNTQHRVLMAPYHRADRGIVEGFKLFAMPVDDAKAPVLAGGYDIVADCLRLGDAINRTSTPRPFRDAALGKIGVDWLEPLPIDPRYPDLRYWRVKR